MVPGLRVQVTRHHKPVRSSCPDAEKDQMFSIISKGNSRVSTIYLHPGSGESAPDWKIPFPPMETWLNNVPDHAGTAWEPGLPQRLCTYRLCLPGSHRGFPKLLNPPNSVMQLLGPARLRRRVLGTTYNQAGSGTGDFGAAAERAVEIPNIP